MNCRRRWIQRVRLVWMILLMVAQPIWVIAQDLTLTPPETQLADPKSFLTLAFRLENNTTTPDDFDATVEVPSGWTMDEAPESVRSVRGYPKMILLSVYVPRNSSAEVLHPVKVTFRGRDDRHLTAVASVEVRVKPHHGYSIKALPADDRASAGDRVNLAATLTNEGNSTETYALALHVTTGWKSKLSPTRLTLEPGQSTRINVTAEVDVLSVSGQTHPVLLEVIPQTDPEQRRSVHWFVNILPKSLGTDALTRTLKTRVEWHWTLSDPWDRPAPQMTLWSRGAVDDRHWVDFLASGPFYTDRVNDRLISQDILRLDLGNGSMTGPWRESWTDNQFILQSLLGVSPGSGFSGTQNTVNEFRQRSAVDPQSQSNLYSPTLQPLDIIRQIPADLWPQRKKQILEQMRQKIQETNLLGGAPNSATTDEIGKILEKARDLGVAQYLPEREDLTRQLIQAMKRAMGSAPSGRTWQLSMGNTFAQLTPLTSPTLSGRGVRYENQTGAFHSTLYFAEPLTVFSQGQVERVPEFHTTDAAAQLEWEPRQAMKFDLTYWNQTEHQIDPALTRTPQSRQILSVKAESLLPHNGMATLEMAGSVFDQGLGLGAQSDWAMRLRPSWNSANKKFYVDGEFVRAGSDFGGQRRNELSGQGYLRYQMNSRLSLWGYERMAQDNVNGDPTKPTITQDVSRLGLGFSSDPGPLWQLSAQRLTQHSQGPPPLTDSDELNLELSAFQTFHSWTFFASGKIGQQDDHVMAERKTITGYDGRLTKTFPRWSYWLGVGRNVENSDLPATTEQATHFFSAGGTAQIVPNKLYATAEWQRQQANTSSKANDTTRARVVYDFDPTRSLSVDFERKSALAQSGNSDWRATLTFRQDFGLPLPWAPIKCRIQGKVFTDENADGICDKGDPPFAGLILRADSAGLPNGQPMRIKGMSDSKGRFSMPALNPGEYQLSLDPLSLPIGYAAATPIPASVQLRRGQTFFLTLSLVRVASISGAVFEIRTEEDGREKRLPQENVRMVLMQNGKELDYSFSRRNGGYRFTQLGPGTYLVRMDPDYLPKFFIPQGKNETSITLKPTQEASDVIFLIREKPRAIIFTDENP